MELIDRPYAAEADLPAVADLIRRSSPASRHRIDYPWRLASPALQGPSDARIWQASDGTLAAFAAWQAAWATLDVFLRPGPDESAAAEAAFAWAAGRFAELDAERGQALPYWVEARDDDPDRLALIERHGYTLDGTPTRVIMQRSVQDDLAPAQPPAGYTIRPLADASEVDAYVALHWRAFASAAMTAAWRTRTLAMPQYRPDLDLVAVAPDGRLAGFCVGWLAPELGMGQVEPLGVDPAFRGRGLSRALLLTLFHAFLRHGADRALVEVEDVSPARRAYEAVGFRFAHRVVRKGRRFPPS